MDSIKYYSKWIMVLGAVMALGACSKDKSDSDDDEKVGNVTIERVSEDPKWGEQMLAQWSEYFLDEVNWSIKTTNFDDGNSMVIFASPSEIDEMLGVNSDDFSAAHEVDILAAFVGDECHGIATCDIDENGKAHYNLLVHRDENDPENFKFVLKSYIAVLNNVVVSEPISFIANGSLGTYAHPYSVPWTMPTESGYYIVKTTYSLSTHMKPQDGDRLAVFDQDGLIVSVGGYVLSVDGTDVGSEIKTGVKDEVVVLSRSANPSLTFKYYRAQTKTVYTATGYKVVPNESLGVVDFGIK